MKNAKVSREASIRKIDDKAFATAHSLVCKYLVESAGNFEFKDFKHPVFLDNEVNYKRLALARARKILTPCDWRKSRTRVGLIRSQVAKACSPRVSANLLQHRYGPPKFLKVSMPKNHLREFEGLIAEYFWAAAEDREAFSEKFDALAEYLRAQKLSCQWAPMSYLAFLANDSDYFPIRSDRFERLLKFYGFDTKIKSRVTWARYRLILGVADELKERLLSFGLADSVEIQSYMWIAGYVVEASGSFVPPEDPPIDFDAEIRRRCQKRGSDENVQRIGVLGERFVFFEQKRILQEAGREDLAKYVDLVSRKDDGCGYDILSFTPDGETIHIEVKSTMRSVDSDIGFSVTDNEWRTAESDPAWRLFRVWEVNTKAHYSDLGNVAQLAPKGWNIRPGDFRVEPSAGD